MQKQTNGSWQQIIVLGRLEASFGSMTLYEIGTAGSLGKSPIVSYISLILIFMSHKIETPPYASATY